MLNINEYDNKFLADFFNIVIKIKTMKYNIELIKNVSLKIMN